MSRRLWIDTRGQPVITITRNGEQNAKRWGWTEAVAVTAADRPSVTDNARAEAERRYGTPDFAAPNDRTIKYAAFIEGAEWAAGRAETTTDEWPRCKASRDGACDRCHDEHGRHIHCRAETTTATIEDALGFHIEERAGVPVLVWSQGGCSPATTAERAMWNLLLATARTRPAETTTEWGTRNFKGEAFPASSEQAARHSIKDSGTAWTLVRREVTAWTEADR